MNTLKIVLCLVALTFVAGCKQVGNITLPTVNQNLNSTVSSSTGKASSPTAVVADVYLSDQQPDNCGSPQALLDATDKDHHAKKMTDGHISFWGDAWVGVYLSAQVSGAAKGIYSANWYIGETDVNPLTQKDFSKAGSMDRYVTKWVLHSFQDKLALTINCTGKSYIHLTTPSIDSGYGVEGTWLSPRKVVILLDGKVIGEKQFYFQQ